MSVLPVGPYAPVVPITPVKSIVRKTKSGEKSSSDRMAAAAPARTATALASHTTRAALDEMKLGG